MTTCNASIKSTLLCFKAAYWKLFSIHEIENDVVVRLFGGAVLLGFLVCFKSWENDFSTTALAAAQGKALCWPFFQGCYDWFFMNARPYGSIQNTIYMGFLGVIFAASYGLMCKRYTLAHICIFLLFIWKFYITSINYGHNANYDYYQTAFSFVFLFLPQKRFFGSLSVVFFYFLSTATKIHESWTLGSYFTAMKTGLPLIPKEFTIIFTNFLIFMEMVASWFLFSRHKILQRTVFSFFVIFHLYSGITVGYHYPTIVTPALMIFFGPLFKPFSTLPNGLKSIPGWIFIVFLFGCQMISHVIPGDEKFTLEGNFYGLYMFEANHQCSIKFYNDKNKIIWSNDSTSARYRCDPYRYMFGAKKRLCWRNDGTKYRYVMDHSINGGPFYRIVDEADVCALTYKPFSHNKWIKFKADAEAVGRPRQNLYY